jgi:hypothetical protein
VQRHELAVAHQRAAQERRQKEPELVKERYYPGPTL